MDIKNIEEGKTNEKFKVCDTGTVNAKTNDRV